MSRELEKQEQKSMQKNFYARGSKAVWPAQSRRCVATGKAAQRRRFVIMAGIGCRDTVGSMNMILRHGMHGIYHGVNTLRSTPRAMQISIALTACGIAFIVAALYNWGILLGHWLIFALFAALCVLITLIAAYLWFEYRHNQHSQQQSEEHEEALSSVTMHRSIALSTPTLPGQQLGHTLRVMARQTPAKTPIVSSSTLSFPETPVPATPLIRVLETVDLSTVNAPHFIDTTSFRALASSPRTEVEVVTHKKRPQQRQNATPEQ